MTAHSLLKKGFGLLLGWLVLVGAVKAHPGHQTSAEVSCVAGAGRLEISLVVHEADLEIALSALAQSPVRLAELKEEVLAPQIMAYLSRVFLVEGKSGALAEMRWAGKEQERHDDAFNPAWVLHFEAELAEGLADATLWNGAFCELFDDQINVVQVRQGLAKHSLGFSPYHGAKKLLP
jgi:hypothetical protein